MSIEASVSYRRPTSLVIGTADIEKRRPGPPLRAFTWTRCQTAAAMMSPSAI